MTSHTALLHGAAQFAQFVLICLLATDFYEAGRLLIPQDKNVGLTEDSYDGRSPFASKDDMVLINSFNRTV